jgi:nitroreductase
MMSVHDRTIVERDSIRKRPTLPREVVREALSQAPRATSNSNIQPWSVVIARGTDRKHQMDALFRAAETSTYGMWTECVFRLRDARIAARRKLHRELAWFGVAVAASVALWAAAYAALALAGVVI